MTDTKFSDFTDGAELQIGDVVVGLRSATNHKFDFPSDGFKDGNGNYLLKYATVGAGAVNYLTFTNSSTTTPVILGSSGSDPDIDINAVPQGNGLFNIKTSTGVNAILDEDTLVSDSATALATQQSIKAYVDNRTPSLTNGQLWIGDTGNPANAATLTAGAGVSILNAAGSITISGGGGGYSWTEVTGTTQTMVASNGYILNNAGLVTATLPVTAAVGDTLILQGKGAGLYRIAQNAGQTIHFGSSDTTTGVGGYIEATNRYDSIELVCITANNDFAVLTGSQGSYTVV